MSNSLNFLLTKCHDETIFKYMDRVRGPGFDLGVVVHVCPNQKNIGKQLYRVRSPNLPYSQLFADCELIGY